MPDQTDNGAGTPKASHDTFESLEREMEAAGLSVTRANTLDGIRSRLAAAQEPDDTAHRVAADIVKDLGGKAVMEIIAQHDPDALRHVPVGTAQAEGMGEFDWCSTFATRTRFYPTDPEKNAYDIRDIAHSLSRSNRWGGHINVENFSVAQHSVQVMDKLTHPAARYLAILHDAPEYVLGDMVRPIKRHVPGYSALEKKHEAEIYKRHGLRDQDVRRFWVNVKMADDVCMREESLVLQELQHFPDDWYWYPQGPTAAKEMYLAAYHAARAAYEHWLTTDDAKAA